MRNHWEPILPNQVNVHSQLFAARPQKPETIANVHLIAASIPD